MITSLILATTFLATTQDSAAEPEFAIVSPARGEFVSDLRPVIETTNPGENAVIYIEISPEPQFANNNTIVYYGASSSEDADSGIANTLTPGWWVEMRTRAINSYERSNRYRSDHPLNRWQVEYNLTAVLIEPYGYRIAPCRSFLQQFSNRIVEGWDDPADAIFNFVSAYVENQGTEIGHYDAYEILARSGGVCGHTAELNSALAAAAGYEARILSVFGSSGHVISEVRTEDGWRVYDPLYHVNFERSADAIVSEIEETGEPLDLSLYPGAPIDYGDIFTQYMSSPTLQTTMPGLQTGFWDTVEGSTLDDLAFNCSSQQAEIAARVTTTRHRNIWFIRAAAGTPETGLGEFVYSYFVFDPELEPGETLIDNWSAPMVWNEGASIPAHFLE